MWHFFSDRISAEKVFPESGRGTCASYVGTDAASGDEICFGARYFSGKFYYERGALYPAFSVFPAVYDSDDL